VLRSAPLPAIPSPLKGSQLRLSGVPGWGTTSPMSDEKRAFTVSDRRHFTPEGDVRPEPAQGAPVAADRPSEKAATQTKPRDPRIDEAAPVTLKSFVFSIATQAGVLLQGLPAQGESPAVPADLPAARQMISILEMLQEKTEARRTEEETRLLEGVLFDLRMAFVAASQGETK